MKHRQILMRGLLGFSSIFLFIFIDYVIINHFRHRKVCRDIYGLNDKAFHRCLNNSFLAPPGGKPRIRYYRNIGGV